MTSLAEFISSVETLSDLRGISALNPNILEIENPVTSQLFVVVGAIREPDYKIIPINTTWVVLDPSSIYYKNALKLYSSLDPLDAGNQNPEVILDGDFKQCWVKINYYDDIFSIGQYYNVSGGTVGPKGDVGPEGPKGDVGPAPTVDYAYIVDQVLAHFAHKTLTSIAIVGPAALNSGASSTYSVTATFSDSTTKTNVTPVTWGVTGLLGTISATGTFTASTVQADTTEEITASYTLNGVTVTATLTVAIKAVVVPIYPYYGVADVASTKDETLVLSLPNRGTQGDLVSTFTLDSGSGSLTMFYAYPASYGLAQFEDQAAKGFYGGWDAATGDPTNGASGPLSLNVTIAGKVVPFYLYQTDFPGLGQVTWAVTHV